MYDWIISCIVYTTEWMNSTIYHYIVVGPICYHSFAYCIVQGILSEPTVVLNDFGLGTVPFESL